MKKVAGSISNAILPNPQELVEVSAKMEENKWIIEVKVKKGKSLYYISKYGRSSKGSYIRVGTSCRSMTEEQIEKKYIESLMIPKPSMKEMLSPRMDLTLDEFKKLLIIKNIHYNEQSFEENFHLKNKDDKYNYIAYLLSDQHST